MKSTPKKLICVRVLKNSTYGICNADPVGYYFDGGRKDFTYPHKILTHFMACYGPAHTGNNTSEYVREIAWYRIMSADEIMASGDQQMIQLFNEQLLVFPQDRKNERIHVFRLEKKLEVPLSKQKFVGPNRGYFNLLDVVSP